ncbi:MAG: GDP-mannose 4,6-dehydratase [Bacteroidia bacterium]|nr:GDP-mannose 4,6-dehydratase [Bacteroidia bacterium]
MKVLVTGGAGFIGSNLVEHLLERGDEVKVIDNLSTGRIENLDRAKDSSSFEFIEGTVSDRDLMDQLIKWCDHCYHLAAPVGVKYIMDNPVLTILENIRGIDVVLESVNKYGKRVLVASTSEVYGKSLDMLDKTRKHKLKEDDYRVEGSTQNHRWAYANTKSLDEFLSLAYHKEKNMEVVVVRLFNTVGPRQLSNYGMVIPNFVEKALKGEDVMVFGSGEQRRSFMHVEDVLRALTSLMETPAAFGKVFNVGNPIEISIRELAELVIRKTGGLSKVKMISYEEAYGSGFEDMNRRTADIGRLQEVTGFAIRHDLESILDDIISHKQQLSRLTG